MSSCDSVGIKLATTSSSAGRFSCLFDRRERQIVPCRRRSHCAKFQTTTSDKAPRAFRAHERNFPLGSCNGFVLCGIPYRGWMSSSASYPPYEPASHFPTRGRPKGHREAPLLHLQLSKSSTGHPSMQIANRLALSTVSRLPEHSNPSSFPQQAAAVESSRFLWERCSGVHEIKSRLTLTARSLTLNISSLIILCPGNSGLCGSECTQGFAIIPRSVSPFTKNCMASATSSSPMILTRMRMPVSPSTVFTLPAPASTK